jgi:hypothetical protein
MRLTISESLRYNSEQRNPVILHRNIMKHSSLPFSIIKRLMFSAALISVFSATLSAIACSSNSQKLADTVGTNITEYVFDEKESAESAEKKLVKRFPVGSNIIDFTDAMKKTNKFACRNHTNEVTCEYIIPSTGVSSYSWFIAASINQGKITEIYMRKSFTPYYPPTKPDDSTTKRRKY